MPGSVSHIPASRSVRVVVSPTYPIAIGYVGVDDIEKRLQQLLNAGAEELQAISDVGGGRLIATVKDADGNIIGLSQDTK